MLLSLPQNHPLTEEENLDATQLANQQWIAVIHNDDVHSRDGFVETCVKAGFNHDICLEAGEPLTALGLSLLHNVPEGGYYADYRDEIFFVIPFPPDPTRRIKKESLLPLTKADSHNKPMAHTLRVKGKSDSETICDGWR